MKNLILAIMLLTLGISLPIEVSAKIDAATLARQRAANQAKLSKSLSHRQRIFNKANANDARTLKLDAIPPSPRRSARSTDKAEQATLPGNARRGASAGGRERRSGVATEEDE